MHRPQVLLLGNGINRAHNGINWSEGIQEIKRNNKINLNSSVFNNMPYPLLAIVATDDHIDTALRSKTANKLLFGIEDISQMHDQLLKLLSLKFDHVLTTNYSYEIERVLDQDFNLEVTHKHFRIRDFNKTTVPGGKPESKYLIHTYNEIVSGSYTCKIWHIHGEGRKPATIALGHFFYGKLLGKYQEELSQREKSRRIPHAKPKPFSWIDAFMDGDVYVLGFGFGFSEFDLWWLLNEKKRNGSGSVIYYGPSEGETGKELLMNSIGVKTRNLGFFTKPENYPEFYNEAIQDISEMVQKTERG